MLNFPSLADTFLPSVCRGSSRWSKWKQQGHTGETRMMLFISVPHSSNHNSSKILGVFLKWHPHVCSTSDKWPYFWKPGHHNGTADHSESAKQAVMNNAVQDESISHSCSKSAFTQNALKHWKDFRSADHSYSVISLGALWQESQSFLAACLLNLLAWNLFTRPK